MQKLLFPNRFLSAAVLLSFGLLSTGFMPTLAVQAGEDSDLEFIPVVVRAQSQADYGAGDRHLVITPVQPAAILAVLSDNNGTEAGAVIFEKVEQQLEDDDFENETSQNEDSQSFTVNTPASQNEPNTDQVPGNGNAYGLGNGNGIGPVKNNGNGPGNNNGVGVGVNGNNGNGINANAGNGSVNANVNANGNSVNANAGNGGVNANANANGNGVNVNIDEDGISIDINLGNGNGLGLGFGKNDDKDNNGNGQNNGNSQNNGNGNGNN